MDTIGVSGTPDDVKRFQAEMPSDWGELFDQFNEEIHKRNQALKHDALGEEPCAVEEELDPMRGRPVETHPAEAKDNVLWFFVRCKWFPPLQFLNILASRYPSLVFTLESYECLGAYQARAGWEKGTMAFCLEGYYSIYDDAPSHVTCQVCVNGKPARELRYRCLVVATSLRRGWLIVLASLSRC